MRASVCVCSVCVFVCVCVRACLRACIHECMRVCFNGFEMNMYVSHVSLCISYNNYGVPYLCIVNSQSALGDGKQAVFKFPLLLVSCWSPRPFFFLSDPKGRPGDF